MKDQGPSNIVKNRGEVFGKPLRMIECFLKVEDSG